MPKLFLRSNLLILIALQSAWGGDFDSMRAVLEAQCFDCHGNEASPKGGVDLEQFDSVEKAMGKREIWAGVLEKVESGQMPPPKGKRVLTPAERAAIVAFVEDLAARPDPMLGARDPGKPTLRRLTRLEYNNTIREVFGLRNDIFVFPERLPLEAADAYKYPTMPDSLKIPVREYGLKYAVLLPEAGLPSDSRAEHGFANRGEAMNLSPLLLEKYVGLARSIVTSPKLPQQSLLFRELIADPGAAVVPEPLPELPSGIVYVVSPDFAPNLDLPNQASIGGAVTVTYQFRFNVKTACQEGSGGVWQAEARDQQVPQGAPIWLRYGLDGEKQLKVTSDVPLWVAGFSTAEETSGQGLFTNHQKLQKSFSLNFSLKDERLTELALSVLGRRNEKGKVILTAEFTDGAEHSLTANIDGGEAAGNTFYAFRAPDGYSIARLRVDGSAFSGNHVLLDDLGFITTADAAPQAISRLSAKELSSAARQRLGNWLPTLFRHPTNPALLDRYVGLFDRGLADGKSFAGAMQDALTAALASPEFLYFPGPKPGEERVRQLDNFELASRLSYFLWASPPDLELLRAAAAGKLTASPEALDAELSRMLANPRIRELTESFAAQWLRLDQLYTAKPDPKLFKSFYYGQAGKRTLHGSFLVEPLLLFSTVVQENRSVLDFIAADYTWLNLRLARHYGLLEASEGKIRQLGLRADLKDDLKSEQLNAVWWRQKLPDSLRGGFPTMAGPLTVTSLPIRTSPVKRGAWLLETIFNRPPQEPKIAFVLKEDEKQRTDFLTTRERFEEHRNQPACFSCHVRLDPPGFALEVFDPVGAMRSQDGGRAVDATSTWNGRDFAGPAAFKTLLMEQPEEFVRGFIEHLLSYAIGRKLELVDRPVVTEILEAARKDGWKIISIIRGVVASYPFNHIRNE